MMQKTKFHGLEARYNHIKYIDQQRAWLSRPDFFDALFDLAQIFVRHQAHDNFAITLLHRHHDLQPGYAMVHSQGAKGEDFCYMEELGSQPIFPCAYHYHLDGATEFAPYEFSSTPIPMPDEAFLREVAVYLRQCNLCEVVAVSHLDHFGQIWLESLAVDRQGTVAIVTQAGQELVGDDYVLTEWAIVQGDNGAQLMGTRACSDKESGHTRT